MIANLVSRIHRQRFSRKRLARMVAELMREEAMRKAEEDRVARMTTMTPHRDPNDTSGDEV